MSSAEWMPSTGDRFLVLDRDMDDQVFSISEMVVEVRDLPTRRHRDADAECAYARAVLSVISE